MQYNKWSSPSQDPSNYLGLQSYSYEGGNHSGILTNETGSSHSSAHPLHSTAPNVLPGLTDTLRPQAVPGPSPAGMVPGVQHLPPPPPDLIRRRPPLPSRPSSFTTTTFHASPHPAVTTARRRRTESSMFSFDPGPPFSSTKKHLDLSNMAQTARYTTQLHAKMDRGFFRAQEGWTCYRRNYFQVTVTFDIHANDYTLSELEMPCLVHTKDNGWQKVDYFSVGISAQVVNSDKKITLIQHTPKRDKGPQSVPTPIPIRPGGNLHLTPVTSSPNVVSFERLQFKSATANNGKRRAAQQYFEVIIELYANSNSQNTSYLVASAVSAQLIIRGRSPGHYADSQTRLPDGSEDQPQTPIPGTSTIPGSTPIPPHSQTSAADQDNRQYPSSVRYPRFSSTPSSAPTYGNASYGFNSYPYSMYSMDPSRPSLIQGPHQDAPVLNYSGHGTFSPSDPSGRGLNYYTTVTSEASSWQDGTPTGNVPTSGGVPNPFHVVSGSNEFASSLPSSSVQNNNLFSHSFDAGRPTSTQNRSQITHQASDPSKQSR